MTDLKPCPFCGYSGPNVRVVTAWLFMKNEHEATAICEECGTGLLSERRTSEKEAIELATETWNTRPTPEITNDMIDRAESAYEEHCFSDGHTQRTALRAALKAALATNKPGNVP